MLTTEVNLDHIKIDSEAHKLKTNIKRMVMSIIWKLIDHVKKLLKTMLIEMLGPDVIYLILRWNVVRSNLVFLDQVTDVEESQSSVLSSRTERTIAI